MMDGTVSPAGVELGYNGPAGGPALDFPYAFLARKGRLQLGPHRSEPMQVLQ